MPAWLALWLLLVAAGLPRVSMVTSPRILSSTQRLRIECRIARHPENRHLLIGVQGVTESYRQLEGDQDQVIHILTVQPLGCAAPQLTAYCQLHDSQGHVHTATQPLLIWDCGEASSQHPLTHTHA